MEELWGTQQTLFIELLISHKKMDIKKRSLVTPRAEYSQFKIFRSLLWDA
jgi:hypothetical protein